MAGLNITDIPQPPYNYRIDLMPHRGTEGVNFESLEDSKAEELRRVQGLMLTLKQRPGTVDTHVANELMISLAASYSGLPYESLASSMFMRVLRANVCGALWQLMDEDENPATGAIVRPSSRLPAEELDCLDPQKMHDSLRTDLYRAGAAVSDGWFFGYLHGEFIPNEGQYLPHWHFACSNSFRPVIDRLRQQTAYQPAIGGQVHRPVWMTRAPLTNMPAPATYVMQSYWPSRAYFLDADGKERRVRRKRAIPEPYHSKLLLWMDRWEPKDLALLIGLRVTREGLIGTRGNL